MLAEELVDSRYVTASSIIEWRFRPDRLNQETLDFLAEVTGSTNPARASGES
jgi:hypothetical protein